MIKAVSVSSEAGDLQRNLHNAAASPSIPVAKYPKGVCALHKSRKWRCCCSIQLQQQVRFDRWQQNFYACSRARALIGAYLLQWESAELMERLSGLDGNHAGFCCFCSCSQSNNPSAGGCSSTSEYLGGAACIHANNL